MNTAKKIYQAPQIVGQGSAVVMTASTTIGQCYDGSPYQYDHCACEGSGSQCKAAE